MSLLDELKQRLTAAYNTIDQIENRISDEQASLRRVAVGVTDLERAIAALEPAPAEPEAAPYSIDWGNEPAPAEQAPTSSPSTDEGRSVTPATEEESGDQFTAEDFAGITIVEDPTLTQDVINALIEEDQVWTQEQLDQLDADAQAFVEAIGAPQVSIVDDPELQAAVARAEQALAIDAQTCEPIYPHPQPAYVGLQDPELDAEYEAMREREMVGKPKLHFSIFGERGNRKLEEV